MQHRRWRRACHQSVFLESTLITVRFRSRSLPVPGERRSVVLVGAEIVQVLTVPELSSLADQGRRNG